MDVQILDYALKGALKRVAVFLGCKDNVFRERQQYHVEQEIHGALWNSHYCINERFQLIVFVNNLVDGSCVISTLLVVIPKASQDCLVGIAH